MNVRRLICILLCLIICMSALCSCSDISPKEEIKTQSKSYYDFFDTVTVIFSYKGDTKESYEANCQAVEELLREYHRLFDIYFEYSGINNLKTVNENAGAEPVKVDEKLIDFLLYCKELYSITGGATNIAMGSVLKLWHDAREDGIDHPETAYIPSSDALSEAAKHTDINQLIINEEESTVFISDPEMSLDVGAIGKGYATEMASELLRSLGVSSYVLNVGGNISAIGEKTDGRGWVTGITNPNKASEESFACRVEIRNTSLVTSGDYERYYMVDGVKYHHIIDPKTNMPAKHFSSVSVFTKNGGLADALSTALFCMSYEDGKALVEKIGGVDVIWISSDGTLQKTDGIELYNN